MRDFSGQTRSYHAVVTAPLPPTEPSFLQALGQVLESVDALRNAGALWLLLASLTTAGLLLTLAQGALLAQGLSSAALFGGMGFFVVFYGSNGAGMMLMDQARGLPVRDAGQAFRDALHQSHLLFGLVLLMLLALALCLGLAAASIWLAKLPGVGPAWLGLMVVLLVPGLGGVVLALVALAAPLAAPAVWYGLGFRATLVLLRQHARAHFAQTVLLTAAVGLLGAVMAAGVSFVVLIGGRVLAWLAVLVAGIDLAPEPFMAALLGLGTRVATANPHQAAAHSGAGIVFAVALVLPGLVYLRGLCAVFLALQQRLQPTT